MASAKKSFTSGLLCPSSNCLSVRLSHFWFAYNYITLRDRAFIFGLFDCTMNFEHLNLTMTFGLYMENFNSAHVFSTIRHRAFILGKCVLFDRTFPMVL